MEKRIRYTGGWGSGEEFEIEPATTLRSLRGQQDPALQRWAQAMDDQEALKRRAGKASKQVLIIEDDKAFANLLFDALSRSGYRSLCAFGGLEGVDMVKTFRPALVILDMMMPDLHGFEVAQEIRSLPELSHTKVLISTAKNYPRHSFRDLGGDSMLIKPYPIGDLLDEVKRLMDGPITPP